MAGGVRLRSGGRLHQKMFWQSSEPVLPLLSYNYEPFVYHFQMRGPAARQEARPAMESVAVRLRLLCSRGTRVAGVWHTQPAVDGFDKQAASVYPSGPMLSSGFRLFSFSFLNSETVSPVIFLNCCDKCCTLL